MSSSRSFPCHVLLTLALAGCADESADASLPTAGAGGIETDGSAQGGSGGAGGTLPGTGHGSAGGSAGSAANAGSGMDAGLPADPPRDAGRTTEDAHADAGSLGDAGWIFGPSCCKPHEEPGCKHAQLEQLVCDALPSCCEAASGDRQNAWDEACVLYVEHQYYDPSVRDCVCDADQGGQSECCDVQWTNTCSQVAESFCDAPWTC